MVLFRLVKNIRKIEILERHFQKAIDFGILLASILINKVRKIKDIPEFRF